MTELMIVALVILTLLVGIALLAVRIDPWATKLEEFLTFISTGVILAVMLFVCAEVMLRYVFNSPIPAHLEIAELFVPVIVFLAIAYTQSQNGHVGMTLVVDNLPPKTKRFFEISAFAVSMITYGILTYFSAKHAYRGWLYDGVTMSPPYFPTWPAAMVVPLGMFLCTVRLYLQMLRELFPHRFPPRPTEGKEIASAD